MKKNSLLTFLSLCFGIAFSQSPANFFPPADLIKTGVYYYPEQWPKSQWGRDLKNIKAMGFEFTHMAEFSWAMLEPEEGRYDFSWLDEAVALAAKAGLPVIMCTPTPTPPSWLTKKYPEVLLVKDDGTRAAHGGREHFSWSSAKYRELCEKIVTRMAQRYGNNPAIYGWQIDNEPSHYGTVDYGPEVRTHFQQWLKKKYGTIEAFNRAWGTAFWSLGYSSFDDILLPNAKTNVQQVNPHALLDFARFNAEECADFVSFQAAILRKHVSKTQWVTTNFMDFHSKNNAWLNDKDLDFISYTMYPVGGGITNKGGLGEEDFRMGFPNKIALANDFSRYKKGFTAVMEMQPGQVNWGLYNPQIYPGIVRAWLWSAYAGGCKLANSYRFRQPLYGGEQYHYGMTSPDGVTPSVGGKEYSQFIAEIKELRKQYNPSAKMPASYAAKKTALLFNWDNFWDTEIQPQTTQWNPHKLVYKYHRALKELGLPVDFISEDMDFGQYPFILAPMYQLLDQQLIHKLEAYVKGGGHLIFTARSGQKDRNGHLWEAPYGKIIEGLTGSKLLFYDALPDTKKGTVSMDAKTYEWSAWADVMEPLNGTETLAAYTWGFYKTKAAATFHGVGKGSVSYIGADTDNGRFEKDVLQKIYEKAKVPVNPLPEGLMLDWRDGFWIAVNYHSEKTVDAPIPAKAKALIGQKALKPAEVAVWREE